MCFLVNKHLRPEHMIQNDIPVVRYRRDLKIQSDLEW